MDILFHIGGANTIHQQSSRRSLIWKLTPAMINQFTGSASTLVGSQASQSLCQCCHGTNTANGASTASLLPAVDHNSLSRYPSSAAADERCHIPPASAHTVHPASSRSILHDDDQSGPSHYPLIQAGGFPKHATSDTHSPSLWHSKSKCRHRRACLSPGTPRGLLCQSRKPWVIERRRSWLLRPIVLASMYSTLLSGLWLGIAICRFKYSHIGVLTHLDPQTAAVLSTGFSKSIELSFVTVYGAMLGQILSQRALEKSKSITIADMLMRSWVVQPETIVTQWESVRHAAFTYLGIFTLLSTLTTMLYTTAADTLVAPKLKYGKAEHRVLIGRVINSYANNFALMDRCTTPISKKDDPEYGGSTCAAIEDSGEAFYNYMKYLGLWTEYLAQGNCSEDLAKRPPPAGVSANYII